MCFSRALTQPLLIHMHVSVSRCLRHTWKTSTPECVTARLILIPSPSWAGWGLMPYISSFLATSSSWISESAGDIPLQREKGWVECASNMKNFQTEHIHCYCDYLCLLWNLMILWSKYSWLGTYCFISKWWQSSSSLKSPSSAATHTHQTYMKFSYALWPFRLSI